MKLIEVNAPAMLQVAIRQALEELQEGRLEEAKDILSDAYSVSINLVKWFQELQILETRVPVSWTEFKVRINER